MMKPKNANFIQLHIEKVVLGMAGLVAAVVLFLYVVGSPWAVEVNGDAVPPGRVPQMVSEAAERLDRELARQDAGLPAQKTAPYANAFRTRAQQPIADRESLAAINEPGLARSMTRAEGIPPYDLPTPPVAAEVTAHASYGVLDTTGDVQMDQQLREITRVANRGPADFRYVTVGAKFNMDQWRDRLAEQTARSIPPHMWNNSMQIAGVYLQRRELIDPVRNQWSDPVFIGKIPTTRSFEPNYTHDYTVEQADQDLAYVRQNQEQLAQTPFVPMGPQSVYLPPFVKRMNSEERKEYNDINQQIEKLQAELQTRQDQLDRVLERQNRQAQRENRNQRTERSQPNRFQNDPFGMDMQDFGPPPGFEDNNRRQTNRGNTGRQTDEERLQSRIAEINSNLQTLNESRRQLLGEELMKALQPVENNRRRRQQATPDEFLDPMAGMTDDEIMMQLGIDPMTGGPLAPGMANPRMRGNRRDNTRGEQQEPEANIIEVRAHDLTVEPGKTYQYRVVVSVLNPLFRQSRVNPQQREENYNRLTLGPSPQELANSPWSEEVTVDKMLYFFVTSADSTRQTADVEIWRLYDGKWRMEQFAVEPGDPIGGTATINTMSGSEMPLPMLVDGMAVDMVDTNAGAGMSDTTFYYVQPETDALMTRNVRADQSDPTRIRLQNEAAIAEQLTTAASGMQSSMR